MAKKWIVVVVCMAVAVRLCAQQQLVFRHTTLQLDTLTEGERKPIFFPFENQSDDTIHITQIKTSCGCTGATLRSKMILPHQRDTLFATYETIGHLGAIHTDISLSDSKNNRYTLHLSGFVKTFSTQFTLYFSPVGKNDVLHYTDNTITVFADSSSWSQQYVLLFKNNSSDSLSCSWELAEDIKILHQPHLQNKFLTVQPAKQKRLAKDDVLLFFATARQMADRKNYITAGGKKITLNYLKKME